MTASGTRRLIDAVLADPGDLGAIQVYADALLAAGDVQGEAIQLACRLETIGYGDPKRPELERRLDEIEQAHLASWTRAALAPVADRDVSISLVRGLPAELNGRIKPLTKYLDAVAEVAPICALAPWHPENADLAKLIACKAFPSIRRFELSPYRVSDKALEGLFGSRRFPALERLSLRQVTAKSVGAIAKAPLDRLTHLSLEGGNDSIPLAAIVPLLERAGPRLRELRLSRCTLGVGGIAAIAEHCRQLRVLGVSRCAIDAKAATRLATEGAFASLEVLELGGNPLKPPAIAEIAGSKSLGGIARVSFAREGGDPPFGAKGLAAFADAVVWPKLRVLDLAICNIRAAGVPVLGARKLANLEELALDGNALGDAGVTALAKLELPKLRVLSLHGNSIKAGGMAKLAAAPWLAHVEELSIAHNKFGSKGGQALGAGKLDKLRVLRIGHNWMGSLGLRAILHHAPSLVELDEGDNNYDRLELLKSLLAADPPPRLRELVIYGVKRKQLDQLAASPHAASLRVLDLSSDELDDARAEQLAASKHLEQLDDFVVRAPGLGAAGKAALRARFGDRLGFR